MKLIKGSDTVERLSLEIEEEKKNLNGLVPGAAIVRVGNKQDDIAYERGAIKTLNKYGVKCHTYAFPEDITHEEFMAEFKAINESAHIHGILLLRPLPSQINSTEIEYTINPLKDIDGISPLNIGKIFNEDKSGFAPCTAEAAMEMLKTLDVDLCGKKVVIVGAGMVVGRPLSLLMLSANATVTVCNVFTKSLVSYTKNAEVLVVATGVRNLIKAEHVAPGSIIIDVGINVDENGKLCGDVKFDEVSEIVEAITPVPGGVGVVTTCILARNVYKAARMLKNTGSV